VRYTRSPMVIVHTRHGTVCIAASITSERVHDRYNIMQPVSFIVKQGGHAMAGAGYDKVSLRVGYYYLS
jgi:hypothetical protein